MELLVFLIAYVAFFIISIPIHELGHLVFGLLSGYRFSSFRLFSFVWLKEDGKLLFKRSRNKLVLGQCLMIPPKDEKDFKFVWYNLGGGLFNLLTAGIFLTLSFYFSGNILTQILIAGIAANIAMGLMNLIPISIQVPNDGMNVVKALQSPQARHGFYVMMKVNEEMMNGKRFRDYDDSFFKVDVPANFNNYFVAYLVLCDAARLYDSGQYEKSIDTYGLLNLNKLQTYYRNSVMLDYLYFHTIHKPDYTKATEIYARRDMKKYLKMPLPTITRPLAAYEFFVNNDKEKAELLLKKAHEQTESFPNKGLRIMEKDYLNHLEHFMQTQS